MSLGLIAPSRWFFCLAAWPLGVMIVFPACKYDTAGLRSAKDQGILTDSLGRSDIIATDGAENSPSSEAGGALDSAVINDSMSQDITVLPGDMVAVKPEAGSTPDFALKPDAPAAIWEVSAVFFQTDFEAYPVEIFGSQANDNQIITALLDGTSDDTYDAPLYSCGGYSNAPKARTWDIERKYHNASKYRILVRGQSDADCGKSTNSSCSGEVKVNSSSGWKKPGGR